MYLLYSDETNTDPETSDFFVYGGVAIHSDSAESLSHGIGTLRAKNGYGREDVLKFNTRERPAHIDADTHRRVKQSVMGLAAQHGVTLLCSMILHAIAKSPDEARRKEINRIAYHYNCFLNRKKDVGLVLVDTFTDAQLTAILREKFSIGLRNMPYSKEYRLDRILGYHLATIGSSHFCSLIDIVLGSLRFVVNARKDPKKQGVSETLLRQLSPICYRDDDGRVSEICLFFSPKTIKITRYREEYEGLASLFTSAGMEPAQMITGL